MTANPTEDLFLHGSLDDVRLWSRALTAPEVTGTRAYACVGLQADFRLNEGFGTLTIDSVGAKG